MEPVDYIKLSDYPQSSAKALGGCATLIHPTASLLVGCDKRSASTSPRISKSFWNSIDSIQPDVSLTIAPVEEEYPIDKTVMVKLLHQFIKEITIPMNYEL